MMTMLITALGTATSFAALASDELDISSCTVTGTDKNGKALADSKGDIDLTKLIDGKEDNIEIGSQYIDGWQVYNEVPYSIVINLDGTESFSGFRVYHKNNASNYNGVLNYWYVDVLFKGETEWKNLGDDYNRYSVSNNKFAPTTKSFGYNLSNVEKVRIRAINVKNNPQTYLVLSELALVGADGSNNTFKASDEITAIPAAEAAIDAIGEVTKSADCLAKIEAAEKACAAFTDEQLTRVRNYSALLAARAAYDALSSTLADDEISLKGHAVTGTDKNGKVLTNSKGEVDLTKLIDGEETNITIGAEYTSSRWETYNEMSYNIDIALDGTESFSGMRVYHKANAWTNWDGVLNDWNVFVMFNGETEWKKLAYDYNRLVDKDGNKITNVPNGTIGATATLFGYNVSNVKTVRFQPISSRTGSGMPMRLIIPEIALIGADESNNTFKSTSEITAIPAAEAAIDAIGEVTKSADCLAKIEAAEKACAAFTDEQLTRVRNYSALLAARAAYDALSSTLADDEISLKGHAVTGTDKNGKVLTNSKGEVDLTKLIDGEETNITIGAEYTSSRWETYNEMSYNIDIALDGTESFSGMRVYHKANAWTNWDGVLNDWNVFVMFNGETEWKKLAYDYNRLVDKDGNKITNVPNGTIGATATLFGYNVSNVKTVRFQPISSRTGSGMPMRLIIPEIALIGADDTKTTFTVSADISSVNPVIVNIDSLGEASLTSEFSKKLSTLEAAYAALSESQKALVINYHKLTAARDEYNSLLKAALTLTVTADSGVYSDKTGVIRFISTFNTIPVAAEIESYGTYVLNFNAFKSGEDWKESQCAVFTSEADGAPEDGESFAVDLYVPEANLSDNVAAMSFVKVKGYDYPILTYFMSGVNVLGINTDVKNLGEKSK